MAAIFCKCSYIIKNKKNLRKIGPFKRFFYEKSFFKKKKISIDVYLSKINNKNKRLLFSEVGYFIEQFTKKKKELSFQNFFFSRLLLMLVQSNKIFLFKKKVLHYLSQLFFKNCCTLSQIFFLSLSYKLQIKLDFL